ncbi:hypothetical protein CHUAL_001452 [Chamberlinius hualienensis]
MLRNLCALFSSEASGIRRSFNTFSSPLLFRVTPMLSGEPLKKKKKIDPAIVRMREDRKRRKLEKEIKKLEKVARKYKPIDEMEVPPKLLEERTMRLRKLPTLSEEQLDYRFDLTKEWHVYSNQRVNAECRSMERMVTAQVKALDELRLTSEELYQAALEPDLSLLPFSAKGPVHTPAIENYQIVDGEYKDVTKSWD